MSKDELLICVLFKLRCWAQCRLGLQFKMGFDVLGLGGAKLRTRLMSSVLAFVPNRGSTAEPHTTTTQHNTAQQLHCITTYISEMA
jgi:hypothetical protein